MLGNSSFLCLSKVLQNKNINLDLGVVQLAVGLMISGPVRLVVGSAQSLGMDALAGPYKKKGIDVLATAFTASAHSTSTDVVEKMINPQYAKEVPEAERDNYESLSNELSSSKQGAEYLINAAAGIVVGGIGKGAVKNNNSDIDISKSGFEFEVGGAKKDAQGLYHDEKGRFTSDPNKVETDLTRPSLRAETKREINDRYHFTEDGKAIDLKTGQVIEPPHHYGHIYGSEHRRLAEAAEKVGMTQKQFNDYVNSRPDKFKIENATENLSHKGEKPGRGELNEILDDMQLFLKGRDK